MKGKLRFKCIVYVIAVLTFIYASCYTTFATEETSQEPNPPVQSEPVLSDPVDDPPVESEPEPVSIEEPVSSEDPVPSDVIYDPSNYPSEAESTEEPEPPEESSMSDVSNEPEDSQYEPLPSEDISETPEPVSSYTESSNYYNIPSYSDYNGGGGYNGDVVASLYDVSTVIDNTELKADDWNIVLDLDNKNAANATVGLFDFNFIKDSSEGDSDKDDGQWILYTGYGLLGLGIVGILYVLISTIYRIKHKDEYDAMIKQRKSEAKARKKAASINKRQLKASKYSAN